MAEITLKASTGLETGSGPSKRLRVDGKVPGVVYGLGVDPVAVTVEWRPFRETLITDAGLNVLIDLDIDGDVSLCMVKELQRHPIRGNVLHVDFLRVSRDAAITVEVPIVLAGEAREVEMANGTIDQLLHALTMSAKPADIPNEIVVDISGLRVGDHVSVGDLNLPAGATTDIDVDDMVVTTGHGASEAEPAEGEAEAGADAGGEPAEGDAEG
ncbi:MAG TPA: 50S ribosomal protein L25 [Acidimicrobiales bacterium]|nr:50S ribosomal protein L25 [Acidimicrobiales bacterium]